MSFTLRFRVVQVEHYFRNRSTRDANGQHALEEVEMRTVTLRPIYRRNDPDSQLFRAYGGHPGGEIRFTMVEARTIPPELEMGHMFTVTFAPQEGEP